MMAGRAPVLPPLPNAPALRMPEPAPKRFGNIDLRAQPEVPNPDGTTSTVDSFSVNFDGLEYLLPTVTPDGRHLAPREAIKEFQRTGRHLGVFNSPDEATAYAKRLHEDYARGRYRTRPRQ